MCCCCVCTFFAVARLANALNSDTERLADCAKKKFGSRRTSVLGITVETNGCTQACLSRRIAEPTTWVVCFVKGLLWCVVCLCRCQRCDGGLCACGGAFNDYFLCLGGVEGPLLSRHPSSRCSSSCLYADSLLSMMNATVAVISTLINRVTGVNGGPVQAEEGPTRNPVKSLQSG